MKPFLLAFLLAPAIASGQTVSTEIEQWVDGFDVTERNLIASMFEQAADEVRNGELRALDIGKLVKSCVSEKNYPHWKEWQHLVADLFREHVEDVKQVAPFYEQVAAGLRVKTSVVDGTSSTLPIVQVAQKPVPLAAQPKVLVDFSGVTAGQYLLTVTAGGALSLSPVIIVTPDGTPPTDPTPTNFSDRVKSTASAIGDRDSTLGLIVGYQVALMKTYSSVAEIGADVAKAHEQFAGDSDWEAYRNLFQGEINRLAQNGELETVAQYKSVVTQARTGLTASLSSAAGGEQVNILLIFQIIRIVLDIIEGGDLNIIEIIRQILDIFSAQGMEVSL